MDTPALEVIVLRNDQRESKRNGLVRTVTLLLPNDGPHPFEGMVGDRLHIVPIKINDDETPEGAVTGFPAPEERREEEISGPPPANSNPFCPPLKSKWDTMKPSQQAHFRCGDPEFRDFIGADNYEQAAAYVRMHCHVSSRSDLDKYINTAARWRDLDQRFRERPRHD
jgi:hypothetical protein